MTWPTVSLMMLWAAAKCFKALSKSELCNSYFSFRLSRRGLCEPGIRSCTAAFRWAATHPTGASRCCLPSSSIWRSWSHTGCPRALKTTSAALPHPYEEKKNSSDSMVINTYVSCLISIANKHIIMHPVHLPHTQHRTWGPEISHTYTWVISLSAAGVLAQLPLFKTFTKHHLAGGNQSEQSFLQSFNCVFSSRVLAVLLFSSEQKSTLLDQKIPQEKSDTIYLAPALRWKTGASLPRGTAALRDADTSHRGCYKTLRL